MVEQPSEPEFVLSPIPVRESIIPSFHREGKFILRDFGSWQSFVLCAANRNLVAWRQDYLHSQIESDRRIKFTGTRTFDEAVKLALRGWPEGRKNLRDLVASFRPTPRAHKSLIFDVGGAFPLVPLAVAGDPACMVDFQPEVTSARPVVQIDYANHGNRDIKAESFIARGAALLSVVRDLEASGVSTELRVVMFSKNGARDNNHIAIRVVFKRAGELLDIDRAMFALTHPSVHRRFFFAIKEQHQEIEADFHVNYGFSNLMPKELLDPQKIYIPLLTHDVDFSAACREIQTLINEHLNQTAKAA